MVFHFFYIKNLSAAEFFSLNAKRNVLVLFIAFYNSNTFELFVKYLFSNLLTYKSVYPLPSLKRTLTSP